MPAAQLWLRIVENPVADWPPAHRSRKWKVSLTEADTLQVSDSLGPQRTSPVFPATRDFEFPQLEGERPTYVYFLCFDPAFPALGRLIRSGPLEVRKGLLFSLGLASVIVFSRRADLLGPIENVVGARARSSEVWQLVSGFVRKTTCSCAHASNLSVDRLAVARYGALPLTQRAVVDEFVASIGLLAPRLAVHIPSELPSIEKIVAKVNDLVREMVFACRPEGAVPSTLQEYRLADFDGDSALRETILHQNSDRLVQINAALSYLATQAISGAVPILERRSLIRRYSLLGIGSAILAVLRIARSIERAFANAALETVLEQYAGTAAPLPGLSALPHYDASGWTLNSLARWEGRVAPRDVYPKLPYFSGRFGFRETEYTISAAIHSLAAGASPQWSLLTLTHEILHGHVRNILSLVFQGEPDRKPDTVWAGFYTRFESHLDGSPPPNESLVDSIRTIILTYCCMSITHGSLTRDGATRSAMGDSRAIKRDFVLPDQHALWLVFESEFRNISEVLVHILDLHYFYRSSLERYVPLIWNSWASMPQVKGDPRQYVLRSLLVIAGKEKGTAYERFSIAVSHLRAMLEPYAISARAGASTMRAALSLIATSADAFQQLFRPFAAALILVDLADRVLFVPAIRGALQGGDPRVVPVSDPAQMEEWFDYALDDDFEDAEVVAPAAYLADRLGKALQRPEPEALELTTVRLFLACCSHLDQRR